MQDNDPIAVIQSASSLRSMKYETGKTRVLSFALLGEHYQSVPSRDQRISRCFRSISSLDSSYGAGSCLVCQIGWRVSLS